MATPVAANDISFWNGTMDDTKSQVLCSVWKMNPSMLNFHIGTSDASLCIKLYFCKISRNHSKNTKDKERQCLICVEIDVQICRVI